MQSLNKPLYSNCTILDPDGRILCRSGERRMNWYLNKGLAEKVSETPPVIKLLFKPAGTGDSDDPYMVSDKENRCVVCGATAELTRHHIVPYCYRIHFSEAAKSHSSYDVLPLCIDCHETYEVKARDFRKQIVEELKISEPEIKLDLDAIKAIKAANAIRRYSDRIPEDKLQELREVVKRYCNKEDLTNEDLEQAAELEWRIVPENYACASKKVVESQADIDDFAKRWRYHFFEAMKPQFMPPNWDINKRIYSERLES